MPDNSIDNSKKIRLRNILVLGASAENAKDFLSDLKDEHEISAITVTSRSLKRAKTISDKLGKKFTAVGIDVESHDEMIRLMRKHDLVVSFVGPSYFYEAMVANLSIEAGVDYLSIADDYEAYKGLTALNESARNNNVKILTGFGIAPGVSQLLAKKGYLWFKMTSMKWTYAGLQGRKIHPGQQP